MDSLAAFAMGEANRNNPMKMFDWDKAARLIREVRPKVASAGLGMDWEWTGGTIYEDGEPVPKDKTYTFLASTWATPELDMDDDVQPCWMWAADYPDQTAHFSGVYWPESALAILNAA